MHIQPTKGLRSLSAHTNQSGRFVADQRVSRGGYGRKDCTWGLGQREEAEDLYEQLCSQDRMENGQNESESKRIGQSRAAKRRLKKKKSSSSIVDPERADESESKPTLAPLDTSSTIVKITPAATPVKKIQPKKKKPKKAKQPVGPEPEVELELAENEPEESMPVLTKDEAEYLAGHYAKFGLRCTFKTESGLLIQNLKFGQGSLPRPHQRITCRYRAYLDRENLDESPSNRPPIAKGILCTMMGEHAVIRGWEEALSTMRPGGQRRVLIPSHLAYGASGQGDSIPAHASLYFEMELIRIGKRKRQEVQESDVPLPSSYRIKGSQTPSTSSTRKKTSSSGQPMKPKSAAGETTRNNRVKKSNHSKSKSNHSKSKSKKQLTGVVSF